MNIKISNIDTLSALIDRLICERIKHFFFEKEINLEKVQHQETIIYEIKKRLLNLFDETFLRGYEYLGEKRTFDEHEIIESIDELIVNDIHIGEADRSRLKEVTSSDPNLDVLIKNEKRLRRSNEARAKYKNKIDKLYSEISNCEHREILTGTVYEVNDDSCIVQFDNSEERQIPTFRLKKVNAAFENASIRLIIMDKENVIITKIERI